MRTIKKSDIIFNLDTKHVYVQDFNAKFFTVNETDYYIDYSSADVVATEKEGEIIYSLNLDWKRLRNVGKGVLIFKCINNIPDEDFPDGNYNNEYKVTTDYYIDTFEVEPEEHESVIELIEEETENRISGDTFLSGAIDTLDTKVENYKEATDAAISAETENRIAADGVLSAAVDTLDAKVESYKGEIDEDITGLENALQEEASARSAADTYLSGAIDTLDTKVETYKEETDNAISSETDNRIAADGVISGALDSHSADTSLHFSGVEKENLDSLATNIAAISGITSGDVEQWNKQFDDAKYEMSGQTHVINFYHNNVVKATIDATDFIVDGMVENVVISGGNLVITFNTDSGKQPITIPLTDIFDPSNYYTKTETNTLLSAKADTATTYTKSEVDAALAAKADTATTYTKTEVDSALANKADTSAVTEAITAAVSGKQDTLVSGTNIKTINNESILGSGNIDIQGGGSNVISLTQAEYDALETIDPDALYVISDATEIDMSNYYTKAQTNTLLSAKADTATTYTKSEVDDMFDNIDLSDYYTKEETDGIVSGKADLSYVEDVEETVARAINDLNDAVSGKQDTLVSGTNIKTINNESILGSGNIDIQGGGKAVSGGTNISITTGETADTINCTLPISADSKGIYTTSVYPFLSTSNKSGNVVFGRNNSLNTFGSSRHTDNNLLFGQDNYIDVNGSGMIIGGNNNRNNGNYSDLSQCAVFGFNNLVANPYQFVSGQFNVSNFSSTSFSDSGNTLFSVGNGGSNTARHNAFEIRQNGDIYIADTNDTSTTKWYEKPMIKLQDQLGGSSITVDDALDSGSTNPVQNKVLYNKIDEIEEVTAAAINALNDDVSAKQDTLISGTNIKTINNESILGSGNIDIQGGGVNVVQTTGTSTTDVMSQDAVTTELNGKGDAISFDLVAKPKKKVTFQMKRGGVNGKIISSKDLPLGRGLVYGEEGIDTLSTSGLVETSAITTSVTTASTDSQVPSAKAVYNAIQGGGGSSYTAGSGIDITNDVISVTGKVDTDTYTAYTAATDTALAGKADTATTYTKSETSGATELSSAFAAKQNVLTAGSGITISGDVISAEGGSSVTIDPTLDSGSTNPVANSAITTNINYIKAEAAAIGGDSFWPSSNQNLIGFGIKSLNGDSTSCVEAFVGNGLIKTDTRYLNVNFTNELTSASTTTQVPSAKAVYDALQSGYVTTDTEQTISGRKIFTYSNNSGKAIEFKQTSTSNKVGFSIKNTADTNNEVASFEFRPNTFTIDDVQHPLMYFGHYRNTATANAGVPQTVIGFRQYDQANAAAFHYLMPLPEKAKLPFSLTTSFKNFYAPLGFKNGETIIKADERGVVDMTSEFMSKVEFDDYTFYTAATETALAGKADTATTYTKTEVDTALVGKADTSRLGGLSLVQLTQAEYDALATKDSNTLYVIVG